MSKPAHIGIIMDGNGRWAKARGLPRSAGHRAGVEALREAVRSAGDLGIGWLTVYAFSSENWSRPASEVSDLMGLLKLFIRRDLAEIHRNGVRVRAIGARKGLSRDIAALLEEAEALTRDNTAMNLVIAFNYGGRAEILDAVRHIIQDGTAPELLTEEMLSSYLYTGGLPDPDLIVRTGGEWRLSNFLIWQAAYAEYYTTPTYWPDFDEVELDKAFVEFSRRERRFGRVLNK